MLGITCINAALRVSVLDGASLGGMLPILHNPCKFYTRHLTDLSGRYGLTTGITDAACLGDALAATIKDEKLRLLGDRDVLDEYTTLGWNVFLNVSNERSIAAKKFCQMDPNNPPKQFLENVEASNNPELPRDILLSSMDLQTILYLPQELKGEERGAKGNPVVAATNETK